MNYKIISDGSCDLSAEAITKLNIDIVPFYIEFLNHTYKENVDISVRDFYELMVKNKDKFPKTSTPNIYDYITCFKKYLDQQMDILCICITKKFSSSYQSAINAKEELEKEYPNRKIVIINSTVNTVCQGLLVKEAVRLQNLGYSIDDVKNLLEENKDKARIFFTISGLNYLKHGGRIGKLSSIIGNLFKICPIITLEKGEIFNSGKALSRQRALSKVLDLLKKYLESVNATKDTYRLVVGYGYNIEEAQNFLKKLQENFLGYQIDFEQIGATISVHTGPHPLGVAVSKILDK